MNNDLNQVESTTPASDAVATPVTSNSGMYNEYGQINNPDIAHDIANNEYVARDTEQRYTQKLEGGLTEQEKTNLEIGNMLYEKYPHAFDVGVDTKGQRFYSMKSTIQLATKEPDYSTQTIKPDNPGLGIPHRLFTSQLKTNAEDFSMLDPRINEILLHSLERTDVAAVFSTKGIEYPTFNDVSGTKILTIENSLLSLTKKDVLALNKILKHNEQLEIKEEERNKQAGKESVDSLKELSALLE